MKAGWTNKINEQRKEMEKKESGLEYLKTVLKATSGSLATRNHYGIDETVLHSLEDDIRVKDAKEKELETKRQQREKEANARYKLAFDKLANNIQLRTCDYKSLLQQFKLPSDSPMKSREADVKQQWARRKQRMEKILPFNFFSPPAASIEPPTINNFDFYYNVGTVVVPALLSIDPVNQPSINRNGIPPFIDRNGTPPSATLFPSIDRTNTNGTPPPSVDLNGTSTPQSSSLLRLSSSSLLDNSNSSFFSQRIYDNDAQLLMQVKQEIVFDPTSSSNTTSTTPIILEQQDDRPSSILELQEDGDDVVMMMMNLEKSFDEGKSDFL